ncbi:MAG: hypothetical protein ACI8ZB_003856 [Desulforhopalus sp.]|jgi:hypothetical protein
MKRIAAILSMLSLLFIVTGALAIDKVAISTNVENIVAELDAGKDSTSITSESYSPYVFILEENGKLLVHPSLQGESLKEKAPPVYDALAAADPKGTWIQYEWKGKIKNTFAKRSKNNLIVGSGY